MKEVFVNMGQVVVLKQEGILTTVGLGSCIGLALYDPAAKVGGMGHIFLAKSRSEEDAEAFPGKYADTGIPVLVQMMMRAGARPQRLVAKMAGGAHLFPKLTSNGPSVGDQNIEAVSSKLKELRIPLHGRDVAGQHGRKMRFNVVTGIVTVTAIGKQPLEI